MNPNLMGPACQRDSLNESPLAVIGQNTETGERLLPLTLIHDGADSPLFKSFEPSPARRAFTRRHLLAQRQSALPLTLRRNPLHDGVVPFLHRASLKKRTQRREHRRIARHEENPGGVRIQPVNVADELEVSRLCPEIPAHE